MDITYSESARGVVISRARAMQVVREHSMSWNDYCEENHIPEGKQSFRATDILDWLGY